MTVTVLLFAGLADRVGARTLELPCEDGDTIVQVCERLVASYPVVASFIPSLLYALNEEYADPTDPVAPGDTLALIPPVSGG